MLIKHALLGYWYKNDIMFPQMLTAFIAVDKCTPENGCMQARRQLLRLHVLASFGFDGRCFVAATMLGASSTPWLESKRGQTSPELNTFRK
jgi:hypothetical protein